MCDKPRSRRFAVSARDRKYRYTRRSSLRKEHIDDVLSDVAAYAFARREMHAKTGRSVDLDDAASIFTKRLAYIRCDHIHTGHIEADDLGNAFEKKDVFRMDLVSAVDRGTAGRDIRRCFEMQDLAFRQNAVEFVSGLADTTHRLAVDIDLRQHIFVAIAASWIGIRLVDQLLDRVFAIPNNMSRDAFGNSDQPIIYDQGPKIRTYKLLFDDDVPRIFFCFFE